ncbi:peptidase M48 [candidate division WOR-1 bacterium RIFOXYA12_FULL_43_27]|uniref:Peptidase M48 n=1 Tax=candidate division WOR-1 bacterium RIFOXYC2_FULL_46_14 TaxID=1802587 RepID=A0A1F4U8F3_UNCSA|nr:MAG: peptidase M48 [candidate division WOR-1 bacterium RIFOXYA12_FULL_43_27]OGC19507.1 MAG: peptidase M48 [candidate division WOR-1 bacterium RIFOXYB2_FULL_46_45]OGC30495.1 MAG: peptidase M48 [candidate division WOR-1 bacterium RIFOXYA2_FULL_46_56]OGC40563.1 MAG: peptidase M48 [candidate division WOR-1 bacterium RIFOXYC2_FULL_46_14]
MKKYILFIALLLFLTGCGKVLLTQRQQLLLVSDYDMRALGSQQYQEILSKSKVVRDTNDYQRVLRVGNRIAGAVDDFARSQGIEEYTMGYKWEFNLIDDNKAMNAFCLPGGKIAVYTGLLPVTKDDTGLAVVLAHEIAHALAKHGEERMSHILLLEFGGATLSNAIKEQPEETKKNLLLAFGIGANVGVLLPYNRLQESEADRIGLSMMAYAGYDPHVALALWSRMEKLETSRPPEFLSTHPLSSERIKAIKEEIPEAMKYYRLYK